MCPRRPPMGHIYGLPRETALPRSPSERFGWLCPARLCCPGVCVPGATISEGPLDRKRSAVGGPGPKDPSSASPRVWTACPVPALAFQLCWRGDRRSTCISAQSTYAALQTPLTRFHKTILPVGGAVPWCLSLLLSSCWAGPVESLLRCADGSQSAIVGHSLRF